MLDRAGRPVAQAALDRFVAEVRDIAQEAHHAYRDFELPITRQWIAMRLDGALRVIDGPTRAQLDRAERPWLFADRNPMPRLRLFRWLPSGIASSNWGPG